LAVPAFFFLSDVPAPKEITGALPTVFLPFDNGRAFPQVADTYGGLLRRTGRPAVQGPA